MTADSLNGVIITLFSTASAVGKTLISINMATALARQGYKVCLMDMDLQFGDISNYLDISPENSIADAQRAIKSDPNYPIEEFLTEYEQKRVKFQVMCSPLELAEAYNIEADSVKDIMKRLRASFDYIIVDTTSMFSAVNMVLLDMSTIVTFLGIVDFLPTIKNMKIGMDSLRSLGYDANKIRLVLNRSDSKSQIRREDVEEILGEPFYKVLPNDFRAATSSIKMGVPLVLCSADTVLASALGELVALYTNRPVKQDYDDEYFDAMESRSSRNKKSGWLSKFFS